eukprot:gene4615-5766_t
MTYPGSRQFICTSNSQNNIWWPDDGSGIRDPQCRAAFQYVYNKYQDPSPAQYQFVQKNEFAVLIPDYDQGMTALKAAVPTALCSAGSVDKNAPFGDKSGFSIPYKWPSTPITVTNRRGRITTINLEFCASAAHNPSYWEFYLTKDGFDVETEEVTWDNVEMVDFIGDIPKVPNTNNKCYGSWAYKMQITVPVRNSNSSVLLMRWQRDDPVGECFMGCSDIRFI